MELRTFVKSSLRDILGGVADAQQEIEQGEIIPAINESTFANVESGVTSYQSIEFEVAVNTVEREGTEAKLNVVAAIVNGGISGSSSNDLAHAAKLSFKVPVKFPKSTGE
ncbi:hypothetical protein ACVT98_09405 [Vibrio campbellii]